jgi:hypothetical protein
MGEESRMLAVDFCGLNFNTPLVLLSGCVGFGEEYTRVVGFSNGGARRSWRMPSERLAGAELNPLLASPS